MMDGKKENPGAAATASGEQTQFDIACADNTAEPKTRQHAYMKKHPQKKRAHGRVWRALKDGRLEKGPCEWCGVEHGLIDAHHVDYSKPLEVQWLCRRHHRQWHDAERLLKARVREILIEALTTGDKETLRHPLIRHALVMGVQEIQRRASDGA